MPKKVGHLSVFVDEEEVAELVPCKDEINSKQKEQTLAIYRDLLNVANCIDDENGVVERYQGTLVDKFDDKSNLH